jgi:potassium-dependent mechanosensitive channel
VRRVRPLGSRGMRGGSRVKTLILALGLAWLALPLPAAAQLGAKLPEEAAPGAPPPPTPGERLASLAEQRAVVEKERAAVAERRAAAANPEEQDALQAELDAVDRLLGEMRSLQVVLEHFGEVARREDDLAPPPAVAALGEAPYDLDDLDSVSEALDAAEDEVARLDGARQINAEEAAAAREDRAAREEARRRARDELEQLPAGAPAEAGRRALRLAELESRRAELHREFVQRAAELLERERDLAARDLKAIRSALGRVRKDLVVKPAEIDARIAKLDAKEQSLTREQERSRSRIAEQEPRVAASERALEGAAEPDPTLTAQAAAYRTELQTERQRAGLLADRIASLAGRRQLWRLRGRLLSGEIPSHEARRLAAELHRQVDESERSVRILRARLLGAEQDLDRARQAAKAAAERGSAAAPWLAREARARGELEEALGTGLESLDAERSLQRRVAGDLAERSRVTSLAAAVVALAHRAAGLWDQELFAVQDERVTLGKLTTALLILALGWGAARGLARVAGRLVHRRSRGAEGAAKAVESLSFYVLLAFFVLLALRSMSIPLTAFTLAGGALAVGIGFGSQNIVNNFMSGLILLLERPVRVGDVVEVDGLLGTVERIGPRSTRVRTFENTHQIIPNSSFLERNVLNLTFSDEVVRAIVEVGVAYGSLTREVERVTLEVLQEHPEIVDFPKPQVLFHEFGDSALVFRAYFWVRDVLGRLNAMSDVRFRIDERFREAGIVIAFPQRDVHLDAGRPLPVRLVEPGGGAGPEA